MTHPPRARRRHPRAQFALVAMAIALSTCNSLISSQAATAHEISPERLTPVVLAVRQARAAVVSIRGQKTVLEPTDAGDSKGETEAPRQVNGMGTGTIIDPRGYILTNYHVVADVRKIEVTLDDGRGVIGELIAYDSPADLAIVKIPAAKPYTVIRIGTSDDLMVGESVIALGNAYGYEQTVTRGVVSALGRDVQVSDTQSYENLIQTDASINPGNSGGPLLNINGEMIGVNVAVRAGAQGIGFSIPIDDALNVAAKLLNVQRLQGRSHGLVTQSMDCADGPLRITKVESASAAEKTGLKAGDQIVQVGSQRVTRPIDLERALLDRTPGERVTMEVRRDGQTMTMDLTLSGDRVWDVLGLSLTEEPRSSFDGRSNRFRGGMRVTTVRPNSPAAQEGILAGDILVGIQKWETTSEHDVDYIISRPNLDQLGDMKFYVIRGQDTLFGHINVAAKTAGTSQSTLRH